MTQSRNFISAYTAVRLVLVIAVWCSALTSPAQFFAQDRAPITPAESAAKRLSRELASRKSIEIRTRLEIIPDKVDSLNPPAYDAVEEHYVETAVGQRKGDSHYLKSDVVVSHSAYYSDGRKCADVIYSKDDLERQESIVIKRHYGTEDRSERPERPQPLRLLYVGRESLTQALRNAAYLGEGQVLNRVCDIFLFIGVRWEVPQDHVYYLDKATSIPLKVESYRDKSAREHKVPLWVWTANSLDSVKGHFIPLKSTTILRNDDPQQSFTWITRVQSIEFDNDFRSGNFWPSLDPGIYVLDTIASKRYRVPGGQSPIRSVQVEASLGSKPVQATPSSDWNTVIAAVVFGLGATMLLAGGVRWRSQHRKESSH